MSVAAVETPFVLTERELDVLYCLAEGLQLDEAARRLGLSPNTVKTYLRRLYRRLGAFNGPHAVHRAWERGILP